MRPEIASAGTGGRESRETRDHGTSELRTLFGQALTRSRSGLARSKRRPAPLQKFFISPPKVTLAVDESLKGSVVGLLF